jgi:hypothetical protein
VLFYSVNTKFQLGKKRTQDFSCLDHFTLQDYKQFLNRGEIFVTIQSGMAFEFVCFDKPNVITFFQINIDFPNHFK